MESRRQRDSVCDATSQDISPKRTTLENKRRSKDEAAALRNPMLSARECQSVLRWIGAPAVKLGVVSESEFTHLPSPIDDG